MAGHPAETLRSWINLREVIQISSWLDSSGRPSAPQRFPSFAYGPLVVLTVVIVSRFSQPSEGAWWLK
jgi:hypothetical protein